ncbi:MAG TPA: galactokinase family protein [Vicinamibacterales bacterium]|jgi:galactokinase
MNVAALVEALVDRGLDAAERDRKQALFARLLAAWHTTRDDVPGHAWFVPGRLEVFGRHTDYGGGHALVAAAPRGFAVAASPRVDDAIRVVDAGRGESLLLAPGRARTRLSGWRHYVDTTARRLAANFPGQRFGADVVIASDLPPASGMSSSSALVIAIAEALCRVGGVHDTAQWQRNIRNRLDAAGYYACIENGRDFGTLAGDVGVGTQGGSEDHSAIVAGASERVLAFGFLPSRGLGAARVPVDWQFVVGTCGVKANKTGRVQEAFNRLSSDAAALLEAWNAHAAAETPAISLAAALEAPGALDWLRQTAGGRRNRLDHFIRESGRVLPALAAFERGDAHEVGRLADDSQRDAEHLLGNQIPESVAVARAARAAGAFAACSFGAGFGGAVWALVPASDTARFVQAWTPDAFPIRPGPGLTDLPTN